MRYRRDVSAGIIVFHRSPEGCRFLLLLSRLTKRPLWEFPKGGVDEGETIIQAALHELQEETGLEADDVTLCDGFQHKEDYRFTSGKGEERVLIRKAVTYFLAEARRTEVRLSAHEASDYAWLALPEALTKVRYAARRRMLEAAARAAGCTDAGAGSSGLGQNAPKT